MTSALPMDDHRDLASRVFNQFLDMLVAPEVLRRQEDKELPHPFDLHAYQIIFFPDGRSPQVRVNEEVRVTLTFRMRDGTIEQVSVRLPIEEIDRIEAFDLCGNDDPDCGHVTFVNVGGSWCGRFDFTYNKGLARRHLEVAREFYESAREALDRGRIAVFVDNLFSTAELFAKATLLLLAEFPMRQKATHRGIVMRYSYHAQLGNVDRAHSKVLGQLDTLRSRGRYLQDKLSLTPTDAAELCRLVEGMGNSLLRFLPADDQKAQSPIADSTINEKTGPS